MIDKGIFREINNSVSGMDVARMLGLKVRNGFIPCPVHNDRHPSAKLYSDGWFCHTCQAHGDNVDLVSRMTGTSNYEALKTINEYFNLGFDLSGKAGAQQVPKQPKPRDTHKEWVRHAVDLLCKWRRRLANEIGSSEAEHLQGEIEHYIYGLDLILDDMAVLTSEDAYKQYRKVIYNYECQESKYYKCRSFGQRQSECIREYLGYSDGICKETDSRI